MVEQYILLNARVFLFRHSKDTISFLFWAAFIISV